MKQNTDVRLTFSSIADLMQELGLPAPLHPLITLIDYDKQPIDLTQAGHWFELDFYKISFKKSFNGSVKYGPRQYDFKNGGLAFLAPHQPVQLSGDPCDHEGYTLFFHPDLLDHHGLAQSIHGYGFFSYAVTEALFLSEKEKDVVALLFRAMATELENNIDSFSQQVLVSQLELLLTHSNRFYNRQFITRKGVYHELINRMNLYLNDRLDNQDGLVSGLPSPQEVAGQLQVSQRYLSDILRSLTGKTTQQHIHLLLVEKAKVLLNQTTLTTAEIAYGLGFEHPQSFNKLFKQKTKLSPTEFRRGSFSKTDD
ncbi:AraC family transcriptional regulator [Rhodocytophaga rosea]|uniref:AraC family transcriptional regulator n=1 Tax=Rhodocytophaga rosea TaxID=2704465 RepID=A0A6C0GS14_9BACT|nr:helix-turn-helix domain-containing protein [Rhodocytophaga rosea]QHT70856.1 AraC family transcriptional regulator [Rhodocytophaga rosea]